jgi:hypothetical protein
LETPFFEEHAAEFGLLNYPNITKEDEKYHRMLRDIMKQHYRYARGAYNAFRTEQAGAVENIPPNDADVAGPSTEPKRGRGRPRGRKKKNQEASSDTEDGPDDEYDPYGESDMEEEPIERRPLLRRRVRQ